MVSGSAQETRWATLREAQAASGASLPALRRWYREDLIESVLVPGTHGPQRLVDLDAVLARATSSPGIARRAAAVDNNTDHARDRRTDDRVTGALIEQVAALTMELAELRERVARLGG